LRYASKSWGVIAIIATSLLHRWSTRAAAPAVDRVAWSTRISTQKQGRSGLGLEAQRAANAQFASHEGFAITAEFTEVETGKGTGAA
jgi:hypothetical protein